MSMAQINKKQGLGKGIRALLDTIDDEIKTPKGACLLCPGKKQIIPHAYRLTR